MFARKNLEASIQLIVISLLYNGEIRLFVCMSVLPFFELNKSDPANNQLKLIVISFESVKTYCNKFRIN